MGRGAFGITYRGVFLWCGAENGYHETHCDIREGARERGVMLISTLTGVGEKSGDESRLVYFRGFREHSSSLSCL